MPERSHHRPSAERLWALTSETTAKGAPMEAHRSRVVAPDAPRRRPSAGRPHGDAGTTAARPRVRFARPHYAPGLEWSAYQALLPDWEIVAGEPELPGALNGVDVLVAAAADARLIDAGRFGLIQQIGTGTDRIDVEAATQAGVWVSSLPAGLTGNADGVADTAVLLTLAAVRRLDESRHALADGRWGEPAGRTLAGRTVVVVGLGDVGDRVVARLRGFGSRLIGVRARPQLGGPPGLERVTGPDALAMLAAEADALILCARFARGAPPLLDAEVLGAARPDLVVVNVARGGLVDESALLAALNDGRVGAAGLDVFATEPPGPHDPLANHPRVLALPHVAGVTEDMFRRAGPVLAGELERWRTGRPPLHAVNRPPSPRGLDSRSIDESRHVA
ncbi:MAG TPA: NAD(P)-dependent oxidoreductase [Thermoleophilaceae bacterium]|jgi:phosphoglycerate dehydrogenase-like enzyme